LEIGGIGGGIAMLFAGLIVIGVLIYLAVMVSRNSRGQQPRRDGEGLAILEERFARGEISAQEFEAMRKTLKWELITYRCCERGAGRHRVGPEGTFKYPDRF